MNRLLLALAIPAIGSACFTTASVTRGTTELPGIPFFGKTVVYRQTTEYMDTWTSATLSVAIFRATADQKKGALLYSSSFTRTAFDAATRGRLASVASRIAKKPSPHDAAAICVAFLQLPMATPEGRVPERTANVVDPVAVVNYAVPLYVNAKTPVFGSASFEPKLASDGTLASVKIDETSKLDEGIANLLPVKEYLTSILIPAAASDDTEKAVSAFAGGTEGVGDPRLHALASGFATGVDIIVDLGLEQQPDGYSLVFSHDWAVDPTRADAPTGTVQLRPLALNLVDGAYRKVAVGAKKGTAKKDDESAFTFAGSVKAPKAPDKNE